VTKASQTLGGDRLRRFLRARRRQTCSSCCFSEYVSSTVASHSFWKSASSDGMLVAVGARGFTVLVAARSHANGGRRPGGHHQPVCKQASYRLDPAAGRGHARRSRTLDGNQILDGELLAADWVLAVLRNVLFDEPPLKDVARLGRQGRLLGRLARHCSQPMRNPPGAPFHQTLVVELAPIRGPVCPIRTPSAVPAALHRSPESHPMAPCSVGPRMDRADDAGPRTYASRTWSR